MSGKQKRPKAHHLLPQFYLKAWSGEVGKIAMIMRDGKPEVQTGSEALGMQKDFYTVVGHDGEKHSDVEYALREMDTEGSGVHRTLLDLEFPLEPQQKVTFARWLGLQWLRGRSSRAGGEELFDKLKKMLIGFGLENAKTEPDPHDEPTPSPDLDAARIGPGAKIPDLSGLSGKEREELEEQLHDYEFELPREFQLLLMLKTMSPAAVPFIEAEWHLLRFEEPVLFTSDEPIILQRLPRRENPFLGVGPASADSIYMPLSPSLCLAMIRTGTCGSQTVRDLPPKEAEKVNAATLSTWWSQLFRHPDAPPFPADLPSLPKDRIAIN